MQGKKFIPQMGLSHAEKFRILISENLKRIPLVGVVLFKTNQAEYSKPFTILYEKDELQKIGICTS